MTAAMMRQLRILEIIILCFLAKTLEGKSFEPQNDRAKRGFGHYGGNDFGAAEHVSSSVLQYGSGDEHAANLDSSSYLDSSAISAGHSGSLDATSNLGLQYGSGDEHAASLDSSSYLYSSAISAGHSGSLDASSHLDASSISSAHSSGLDTISHLDSAASNGDTWSAAGLSSGYEVWLEPLPNYDGSSAVHATSMVSSHPASDHIANAVFSEDSANSAHFELPSSQLHTQISSSSSIGNSAANIGGSIHDHGNVAISDNIDFNNVADIKSKYYAKSYGK